MSDVHVSFRKWPARPHWEYDAVQLGQDEHGVWLGAPAGTRLSRPGADFWCPGAFVVLLPTDAAFVATFYDHLTPVPTGWVDAYVDIVTPPVWEGATVQMFDLDLDVVRGRTGRVWVDDEDEFAAHRVRFEYPDDIVSLALRSCEQVRQEVEAALAPYDGVASLHWMTRLDQVSTTR